MNTLSSLVLIISVPIAISMAIILDKIICKITYKKSLKDIEKALFKKKE